MTTRCCSEQREATSRCASDDTTNLVRIAANATDPDKAAEASRKALVDHIAMYLRRFGARSNEAGHRRDARSVHQHAGCAEQRWPDLAARLQVPHEEDVADTGTVQ